MQDSNQNGDRQSAGAERKPRTIYFGATQNGNQVVGGWLPFVVDLSPIYGTMRVHGTLYTDYRSGTWETKKEAVEMAKQRAIHRFAEEGDTLEFTGGCHRCWNDSDASHLARVDGNVCCGTCGRKLKQAVDHGPQKQPASLNQVIAQHKSTLAKEPTQ